MAAVLRFFTKTNRLNGLIDQKLIVPTTCNACAQLSTHSAKLYDDTRDDPGPIFLTKEVQSLLKSLTRIDLDRVYRKRKTGSKHLTQSTYKFMTEDELQAARQAVEQNVDALIQMPPVLAVRKPIDTVLSRDPHLQGLNESRIVFTDITFGTADSARLIVVREPDGTLREAEWELRDRMNQVYFPRSHCTIKIPRMFEEPYFADVLKRQEYEFVLDRACLQFEPNDARYQAIVSVTYQHVNEMRAFEQLRSTRHFGGLVFFLAWHKLVDDLLLELIETDRFDEALLLIELYSRIHRVDVKTVEEYIEKFASGKKSALELAVQAYKDILAKRTRKVASQ